MYLFKCGTRRRASVALVMAAVLTMATPASAQITAEDLFADAAENAVLGNYDKAIELYGDALIKSPRTIEQRITLAHLLRDVGREDEAIRVLRDGLDLDRNSALLHVRLGELVEAAGDDKAAEVHYRKAAELAPDSNAAADANANLLGLGAPASNASASVQSEIGWSTGPAKPKTLKPAPLPSGDFERLKTDIEGQWCLQLIDLYRRENGICVSDAAKGDLMAPAGDKISLGVDTGTYTLNQSGLGKDTKISLPADAARSVDLSFGDRTAIHTVNYANGNYLQFTVDTGDGQQCLRMQQNRQGEEMRICSNVYTMCRCN